MPVIPAKVGTQGTGTIFLGSRLRGNDDEEEMRKSVTLNMPRT